jgi:hypothetical protein
MTKPALHKIPKWVLQTESEARQKQSWELRKE